LGGCAGESDDSAPGRGDSVPSRGDGARERSTGAARQSRLRPFLDDLAERTGILGAHDGATADWRFWHRTFREALTAEHLWEQHQGEEGKAAVLARARAITADEDLSRWAEPLAFRNIRNPVFGDVNRGFRVVLPAVPGLSAGDH
jgi:DNA polymerase III epsilon subunit-like protein